MRFLIHDAYSCFDDKFVDFKESSLTKIRSLEDATINTHDIDSLFIALCIPGTILAEDTCFCGDNGAQILVSLEDNEGITHGY